jgi:hypothetical protein
MTPISLSVRWPEARSIVQDRCERVEQIEDDLIDVRLAMRGLVVRVSIYASVIGAVGGALIGACVYVVLAHFGVHGVQKGATP